MVDIDGPQFRSDGYDPSYGWSIWTNERKLEVKEGFLRRMFFENAYYNVINTH